MDGAGLLSINFDTYINTSKYRKVHRCYGQKNAISTRKLHLHVSDTRDIRVLILNGWRFQHSTKDLVSIIIRLVPSLVQRIRFDIHLPPQIYNF